jgi:hypothetical protein
MEKSVMNRRAERERKIVQNTLKHVAQKCAAVLRVRHAKNKDLKHCGKEKAQRATYQPFPHAITFVQDGRLAAR